MLIATMALRLALAAISFLVVAAMPFTAKSAGVSHSFLALGAETRIVAADGAVAWNYPRPTRDGFVLPNGNILLAVSRGRDFPGGGVVELTRAGATVFEWKGTQSEVNTVQALPGGNYMLTEAGPKPRILEINREGKTVVEVPLLCQTTNIHLQSRMARKLANGNYLVPQLLDRVVREYTPEGTIVWEFKTPDAPKESWPFTAIRLTGGNTLITCTHGNMVIEVDREGKIVWTLANDDLPAKLLNDPCGAQRLPNGNTVICSYAIGANRTKLVEVTRDKKVVWTFTDEGKPGIHEVQVLETNGKPLEGPPLK